MNESPTTGSKTTHSVCARCGSALGSSESTEESCVSCLLHTALGGDDIEHAGRPHRFDQYELITDETGAPVELGRGAMGVTYKAFDTNLRCEVALKVIHPRFLADESSRARFLSEARAAAQLRHRNIASVFHLGSEHGEYFYTMELVEGETIENRVRRKGPIDCTTALDITLQVARALIAAGDRKFVHRDVKPSNVMLCTEADGAIVAKLIDFGLVRGITEKFAPASASPVRQLANRPNSFSGGSHEVAPRPVRTGFIGTPHYASPEQFAGEKTDARSDIYSLGVTLWFMLTGKLPYDRIRDEIRQKQVGNALPLAQLKGVSRGVVDLIKRMLQADPAKRPQSPAVLKEQLHKCIAAIDAAKQKQRRRFAYSALAAVAIVIAALGASYILQRKPVTSAASEIAAEKSIAVLPFTNLLEESDGAYIADGMRAQIVARLGKIANLKVVSGSSAQRYENAPKNPAQVAADLGVADLLEGSVRKLGEKFQIAVRLIDGKNGAELWTQSYQRTFPEIIQVESEVARQTAGALGLKLTEPEIHAINRPATSNPLANEAYLKGRYVWLQRTPDSYRQAREYFEQAIALDSNYALAYAGLADAYQFLGAFNLPDRKENYDKAKSAYGRALELDPTLAEAHATAGLVAMNYDWDWSLAEQELRRAIALNPNEALFYDWYAEYLMAVGKANESIDNIERAHELDPFSIIINSDVGKLLFFARLYDQAEAQLKETLRMDPAFMEAHVWLGTVYLMKQRFDEAIAEFKIGEVNGLQGLMAYAHGKAGRKTEARQMLEATKKLIAQRGDMDNVWLTCAYIGMGEKDRAIACLEQDCENHATVAVSLKSNPLFDSLRSDPRFIELMHRVHLTPGQSAASEIVPEKSIAVLPFENLSDEKEQAFFAGGVQDGILTDLAQIADLKVISRTSVTHYKTGIARNLAEIGWQLDVAHVVEGSVKRSGNHVHVYAQLLDVRTNRRLWEQTYDGNLSNVFAIHSEIAKAIAEQLHVTLSPVENNAIERQPTSNITAFDLYTRAKSLLVKEGIDNSKAILLPAIDQLNQAIARDPTFLDAYCLVAWAHDLLYFVGDDHTPARLALAEAAIEEASHLRPEAGETHLARAWNLHWGHLDYNGALAELEIAHRSLPNDEQIPRLAGYIYRRQGRWEESARSLERAIDLDPRNVGTLQQIALSYGHLSRYAEEERALDRVLAIDPNDIATRLERAGIEMDWKADTRPLHQAIGSVRATNPAALPTVADSWLICALAERDFAAANEALITCSPEEAPLSNQGIHFSRPLIQGVIARMKKEDDKARTAFTAARMEQEKIIQAQPDYGPALCVLGLIDAALGRKEEALREGRRAVELLPVEKDALDGPLMIKYLAMIAAWVGDNDLACEQLAIAVHSPSGPSYGALKLLPWWDPLRGDPRFEKIVASLAPGGSAGGENVPDKSIAVLPFENLSNDREDASFADGVQDDLLTKLAKIADLKVISRSSVMQYREQHNTREIGDALGVSHVLEGSVRKTGAWLHINAQLIDTHTDTHVWAEEYDRDLKDLFVIQSEIAQKVAEQLHARLSPAEKLAIERPPSADLAAFDLYSRAKNLVLAWSFSIGDRESLSQAADLLNQAVAHDPTFFQAYCQLAWVHDELYHFRLDRTPERLALADAAINAAFRLRPDAGEAHLARAAHLYRGYLNCDGALAELETARRTLPNDARLYDLKGCIERRRPGGNEEEALRDFEQAVRLDPRNVLILEQTALSYDDLRRYADEEAILDRVLALNPNDAETKVERAVVEFDWKADVRPLHKTLDEIRVRNPTDLENVADSWLACALAERDTAAAETASAALGENGFGNETIKFGRHFREGLMARMTKDDPKPALLSQPHERNRRK